MADRNFTILSPAFSLTDISKPYNFNSLSINMFFLSWVIL